MVSRVVTDVLDQQSTGARRWRLQVRKQDDDSAVICAVNVVAFVVSPAGVNTSLTSTPKSCFRSSHWPVQQPSGPWRQSQAFPPE